MPLGGCLYVCQSHISVTVTNRGPAFVLNDCLHKCYITPNCMWLVSQHHRISHGSHFGVADVGKFKRYIDGVACMTAMPYKVLCLSVVVSVVCSARAYENRYLTDSVIWCVMATGKLWLACGSSLGNLELEFWGFSSRSLGYFCHKVNGKLHPGQVRCDWEVIKIVYLNSASYYCHVSDLRLFRANSTITTTTNVLRADVMRRESPDARKYYFTSLSLPKYLPR
jgi:hypothetical protein